MKEKENRERLLERESKDIKPIEFLMEDKKEDNIALMCKYFAHRLVCEKESIEGECDYHIILAHVLSGFGKLQPYK